MNGVWTITFGRHGSFEITNGTGGSFVVGKGSRLRKGILTIEPDMLNECGEGRSVGRYRVKLTGNQLQLIRIADPCKTRSNVLSYTFIKRG